MLAHRLRLWANIKSTLVQRLVFAGVPCTAAVLSALPHNVQERESPEIKYGLNHPVLQPARPRLQHSDQKPGTSVIAAFHL